jgi:hypothetical protein
MSKLRIAVVSLALIACQDKPASTGPTPPAPQEGVQAFVTVDNIQARPGQTIRVRVEVAVGSQHNFRVGSFQGRLRFDTARLAFRAENAINDGLRIANNNGAPQGEIRFAGAAPTGFSTLVLYDGTFEVRQAGYPQGIQLMMEELSAALSFTNLRPQLRVPSQVFLRRQAPE